MPNIVGQTNYTQTDELKNEIKSLVQIIEDYKEVIDTLGKGIGHISVPDNFFAFWNDTEVAGSKAIHKWKDK